MHSTTFARISNNPSLFILPCPGPSPFTLLYHPLLCIPTQSATLLPNPIPFLPRPSSDAHNVRLWSSGPSYVSFIPMLRLKPNRQHHSPHHKSDLPSYVDSHRYQPLDCEPHYFPFLIPPRWVHLWSNRPRLRAPEEMVASP